MIGVAWIRYFGLLLIFAGLATILMGLQYHAALVETPPNEENTPSAPEVSVTEQKKSGSVSDSGARAQRSFIQSTWKLFVADTELSNHQAGIVSSGLLVVFLGLVLLLLGPMVIRRLTENQDL